MINLLLSSHYNSRWDTYVRYSWLFHLIEVNNAVQVLKQKFWKIFLENSNAAMIHYRNSSNISECVQECNCRWLSTAQELAKGYNENYLDTAKRLCHLFGWLAYLISWFAYSTRVKIDTSSNPPLDCNKLLQ